MVITKFGQIKSSQDSCLCNTEEKQIFLCLLYISVPSLPPSKVTAHNTSSTSLQMTWGEVPKGFIHGILRGYRVFHRRTDDEESYYLNSTTEPTELKLHITGLKKFTEYSVKVLAFTMKGDGEVSNNISVMTDEDGKIQVHLSSNYTMFEKHIT